MTPITNYREESYTADADGCWPPEVGDLEPGVMQVLYDNGVPVMCDYVCPCGRDAPCPIFFPTEKRKRVPQRPLWDFKRGPNGPTLTPSVRHTGGCKRHYNITDGKVIMHGDSGK